MKKTKKITKQQMLQQSLALAIDKQIKSHTYAQYSQAPAINNFNDQTFQLNNIDMQKFYDDYCNIFTANEKGLYEWCVKLQVGTIALYQIWFRNIRYMDNSENPTTDSTNITPANFANGNGDVTKQDNSTAGNYNETYGVSSLTTEQIRLVVLMKYYSQHSSGSIKNLYDVLTTFVSFYYNQHKPKDAPYDPSKDIEFLVIDCLVNSEFQYQGLMCIYHNKNLWQPYDGSSSEIESEKLQYVFEQSGILPRNVGQILRFIYTPTLPTEQNIKDSYLKPQKNWGDDKPLTQQLQGKDIPDNFIYKTWCYDGSKGDYPNPNVDLSFVPVTGDNNNSAVNQQYGFNKPYARALPKPQAQQELENTPPSFKKLIDKLEDKGIFTQEEKTEVLSLLNQSLKETVDDVVTQALSPTRQNMNGILRQTWDNILFYNRGGVVGWSPNIVYAKGETIRQYELIDTNANIYGYVYYMSLIDSNTYPQPTLASHLGWGITEYYKIVNGIQIVYPTHDNTSKLIIYEDNNNEVCIAQQGQHTSQILEPDGIDSYSDKNYQHMTAFYRYSGCMSPNFRDTYMQDPLFFLLYKTNTANINVINKITLTNGLIMLFGSFVFASGIAHIDLTSYNLNYVMPPIPYVASAGQFESVNVYVDGAHNPDLNFSKGFYLIQNGTSNQFVSWFTIAHLANYVGDTLSVIRNYKISPYYKKLSEQQKEELDQYYINLDKEKDATKVTAPEWWESEIEGKDLI